MPRFDPWRLWPLSLLARRRFRPGHAMPHVLLDEPDLILRWLPGNSDRLVLVFTGKGGRAGALRDLEFTGIASSEERNHVLFVTDASRSWYSRPGLRDRITAAVLAFIAEHGITDVRSIGNSMGGFGAILFTESLPISHVAAFVPQISLADAVLDSPGWASVRGAIDRAHAARDLVPLLHRGHARIAMLFGDQDEDDIQQMGYLTQPGPFDLLVLHGHDHRVAKWLKGQGLLKDTAMMMLNGESQNLQTLCARLNAAGALAPA